jgi:hypothetical protein
MHDIRADEELHQSDSANGPISTTKVGIGAFINQGLAIESMQCVHSYLTSN